MGRTDDVAAARPDLRRLLAICHPRTLNTSFSKPRAGCANEHGVRKSTLRKSLHTEGEVFGAPQRNESTYSPGTSGTLSVSTMLKLNRSSQYSYSCRLQLSAQREADQTEAWKKSDDEG